MKANKELSIYVHIPFCQRKCHYCDFVSHKAGDEEKEEYVKGLINEIKNASADYKNFAVKTVFLGGGTPSILSWKQTERIFKAITERFSTTDSLLETSIEVNPGTVDKEKLKAYYRMGFNRLSFGLQSVKVDELKMLGRIHTYEEFLENYFEARAAGFCNINIDMMSALPKQTAKSYKEGLETVAKLEPEHISAYSLIIEENTPFYEMFAKEENKILLPEEEEERMMYYGTKEILERFGYHRYEISNYAKEGKECMHNNVYWQRGNYLGFGTSAASMVDNIRFQSGEVEKHILSKQEQMEEFIFLGMRRMEGINKLQFQDTFQIPLEEVFTKALTKMKNLKLIEENGNRLFLSEKGIDVSNYVFSEFLL